MYNQSTLHPALHKALPQNLPFIPQPYSHPLTARNLTQADTSVAVSGELVEPPPNHVDAKPEAETYTGMSQSDIARDKLREAIYDSNEVLATGSTVFLVTLFPDIYTIDRTKITVTKKGLFGTTQAMSMRIQDILNASATAGMMFGYLQLTNRIIANDKHPYTIGPFWKSEALRLKRITQGYVIAMQNEIDVSSLSVHELAQMLESLGEDDHPNTTLLRPARVRATP